MHPSGTPSHRFDKPGEAFIDALQAHNPCRCRFNSCRCNPQLVPEPRVRARSIVHSRTILLSPTSPSNGRLRLDAMARYMQDIASDDVADAKAEDELLTWVVRRTLIDVVRPSVHGSGRFAGDVGERSRIALGRAANDDAGRCRRSCGGPGRTIWVLLDLAQPDAPRDFLVAFDNLYCAFGAGVGGVREAGAGPASPRTELHTGALAHGRVRRHRHGCGLREQRRVLGGGRERAVPSVSRERRRLGALRGVLEYRRPLDLSLRPRACDRQESRSETRRLVRRRRRHRSGCGDSPRRLSSSDQETAMPSRPEWPGSSGSDGAAGEGRASRCAGPRSRRRCRRRRSRRRGRSRPGVAARSIGPASVDVSSTIAGTPPAPIV